MKTDLDKAKTALCGHTICLCKGDTIITADKHGILPMIGFIDAKKDLSGFSVADLIVGKAVACLFALCDIKAVYGSVMSKAAKEYLIGKGIEVKCDTLVENIINRAGDDICPMEKCVANIDEPQKAYAALEDKLLRLALIAH